jgi:hypothetical protein
MANIIINDKLSVNGNCTFNREVNEDKTGFIISGVLLTHLYFDDISTIQTKRFKLTGVEVQREVFGSDDYNIGYQFICSDLEILGSEIEGISYILYPEEMKMIEDEMYKDEHQILGAIGKEYKDMIKKEEEQEVIEGSEK